MKARHLFAGFLAFATVFTGCVQKDIGPATISVDPDDKVEFTKEAGTQTVTVTSNYCWEAAYDAEWFTVEPKSGEAAPDGVTVTISALANEGHDRIEAVTFFANHSKLVNASVDISQKGEKGDPDQPEAVTVAEFIAKGDGTKLYQLTGVVSNFYATYCSFDLTDDTGTIYVYSVDNKDEWVNKIQDGGTVTLKGKYEFYTQKSQHEVVNAVILDFKETADEDVIFQESFGTGQGAFTINDVEKGGLDYVWAFASGYGMKASAFKDNTNYAAESWLISPEIDLAGQTKAYLSFSHAINFCKNPSQMKVLVSNVAGTAAGWTEVTVPAYPSGSDWTFVSSGDIDLAAFLGQKIKVAFKYTSTASESPTWEIKNFKISKKESAGPGPSKEPEIVSGTKVEITMNKDLPWATATDQTYGAGLTMTSNGVKVSFFQNTSTTNTDNSKQNDHIRIFKNYVLKIAMSDQKPIKQIVLYCTDPVSYDGKLTYYANDITVGGAVVKRFSDTIVNWTATTAAPSEFEATLTGGQLRVKKILLVY